MIKYGTLENFCNIFFVFVKTKENITFYRDFILYNSV